MDEIVARHRKEQRDLQSQITQKKKSATKKTRKGVNDECTSLENELRERQSEELQKAAGIDDAMNEGVLVQGAEPDERQELDIESPLVATSREQHMEELHISEKQSNSDAQETQQPRKGNRQKARLARRAAEQEALVAQAADEASNLPDLKERERIRMEEEFRKRGLKEKEVAANGHCLYSAVADQMRQLGLGLEPNVVSHIASSGEVDENQEVRREDYKIIRRAAAEYMEANSDDFVPFLEEPFDDYLRKVKDTGEWGGQLELLALAKTYGIDINVLQGDGKVEKVQGAKVGGKHIWLAYYRHGFGLGEHYNSLRTVHPQSSNG